MLHNDKVNKYGRIIRRSNDTIWRFYKFWNGKISFQDRSCRIYIYSTLRNIKQCSHVLN